MNRTNKCICNCDLHSKGTLFGSLLLCVGSSLLFSHTRLAMIGSFRLFTSFYRRFLVKSANAYTRKNVHSVYTRMEEICSVS